MEDAEPEEDPNIAYVNLAPPTFTSHIEMKWNDGYMNVHNQLIPAETWGVNVDFQPVLDFNRVLNYMTKYAAKPESESGTFKEAMKNVFAADPADPAAAATRSTANSCMVQVRSARIVTLGRERLHV